MSEKDFKRLMEIAQKNLEEESTPDEALRSLIDAGILRPDGQFTEPYKHLSEAVSR